MTRPSLVMLFGTALAAALVSAALGGCDATLSPRPKSEGESSAAVVVDEDRSGPYATGKSLSFEPALQPLDPSPVKEVRLDASNKLIEIAPGVKYTAWTLGDQVPGPTVRARVGDKIRFSMTNRTNVTTPKLRIAAPMLHSMDFHSAMGSPQDLFHSIGPGQTISFEFTPAYPGVFMYHCVTPPMVDHVAAGMYGMTVVEPKGGWPTKADREYVVVQGEFYARLDPERRKVDNFPVYVLDKERALARTPTQVVFNGRFNGMVDRPLVARPGERVRLYVLNVGPGSSSSFHVVGTIFDRVWLGGNPQNELRGMQTVDLGASSSAIVELTVPEKGDYILVDHYFANAALGAIGVISVSDKVPPLGQAAEPAKAAAPETAVLQTGEHQHEQAKRADRKINDPEAAKGKLAFESKCVLCHSIGGGAKTGPDLQGVTRRHADAWLTKWLLETEKMQKSDPAAKQLVAKYKMPMPNPGLKAVEVRDILKFFHWSDQREGLAKN
ncbi:MAG TPA: multicopper oxidase domain-containing protein [Burkholderiales bacterium]|nr:multicopper oxidase domain-containing protein [Burkholderiales bacterium]